MNRLKTLITLAVLALWLPATNHCRLELIPALQQFLTCCVHEDATAPHEDADCETDNCEAVENGLYKTEWNHVTVAAPLLILVDVPELALEAQTVARSVDPARSAAPPPELSRVWQFSFRAAAPPRAPSLLS